MNNSTQTIPRPACQGHDGNNYFERFPEATGNERFDTAVAIGLILREREGRSASAAQGIIKRWNELKCHPRLKQAEIEEAVYAAYFQHELAAQIVTEGQVASAPSSAAESTKARDDRSPASVVEATAPSSLTVAALADTTMPDVVVNTPPECALCASRRKAKRERTRRWRARVRKATQPMEVL